MKLIHYISNIFKRYKKNIGDTSVYNANELVDFFAGNKQDNKGRYITTYLKYDPKEIEQYHDFIQWAFPTSKPSEYNPDAPIIDDTFAEHLQENSKALENYCSEYFDKKCSKSKEMIAEAKNYIPGGVQHNLAFNYPFH